LEAETHTKKSWRPYPKFRGWWIVGTSFLALYLNGSATSYLFSIMIVPMEQDLGWSRTTLLGALTVTTLVTAGSGMLLGPIFDRHGARVGMTVSAALSGAFMLTLTQVNSPWQYYIILGIGMGATRSALENVGPRTAIANWFVRRRAAAFAWMTGGRAVFGITAVIPFAILIENTSWRSGWLVIGVLEIAILAPLAWFVVRRRPEDEGLLPDGDTPRPEAAPVFETEWTRGQAMRTHTFWLLVAGFVFAGFPAAGVIANMLPYLSDEGLSLSTGAFALTLFGFGALLGRPIWGFIASRYGVHAGLTIYAIAYAATIAAFVLASTTPTLFITAFLIGIPTGGAAQLQAQAWPDFFGRRSVGTITGVSILMTTPAMALGPLTAAIAFDLMGSYNVVLSVYSAGVFVSAACFYLARKPSLPSSPTPTD
jgi:MFS family permease